MLAELVAGVVGASLPLQAYDSRRSPRCGGLRHCRPFGCFGGFPPMPRRRRRGMDGAPSTAPGAEVA